MTWGRAGRYGRYSERVRHLIQDMEGTFLSGHGDGSAAVLSLEPISPTDRATEDLADFHRGDRGPAVREIVRRVMDRIDGCEGPYGLELLASAHWVVRHESAGDNVAHRVRGWTKRKGRIFTDAHVGAAVNHLARAEG